MTVALPGAPFPVTYRELWLPPSINGLYLPSSVEGGHGLTLTGARKGTTVDGVLFTGAANSNIVVANNAIQNDQQTFHITIRFKLDADYAAGAASNFYLFQKIVGVWEYLRVYLNAADGLLRWEQGNGVDNWVFQLTSTTNSWAAGVWHIVTGTYYTNIQRLLVDGVLEDSDTRAWRDTPPGGDMVIGNSVAAGVDGVIGVISWVVIGVGANGVVNLTADEEQDLSKGIPPPTAKVQYMYLLDEGRLGSLAYDRGSAGGNGTIGAVCTWAWGQVQQPVISFDEIDDRAVSSAGADISGDLTVVWAGKLKAAYDDYADTKYLIQGFVDGSNRFYLAFGVTILRWLRQGSLPAAYVYIDYAMAPAIDDYAILIGTGKLLGGVINLFINGSLVGTASGVLPVSAAAATIYVSAHNVLDRFDVSKPLFIAIIDGAFTQKQTLAYTRWLKNIYNLPISI